MRHQHVVSGHATSGILVAVCDVATAADRYGHLLSAVERTGAAAYPPHRAREFTAGRGLLRWALGHTLEAGAAASRIVLTDRGKPVLADRPTTGISLSHSGGTVAVAVAVGRAVGIDLQAPVPVTDGLLRRCCTPEQQRELAALEPDRRPTALARRWTILEAHAKATGRGLTRSPGRFPGPLLARRGHGRDFAWRTLPPLGGCAAALAFDGPAHRVRLRIALPAGTPGPRRTVHDTHPHREAPTR
ncbi:4'-phosphopantetheinyl transferase family protein [Kitasatospora sp. NPDC004289]